MVKAKRGRKLLGSRASLISAIRLAKKNKRKGEIIIIAGKKVHLVSRTALRKQTVKF